MELTGGSFIAAEQQTVAKDVFYAFNPVAGEPLEPVFAEATATQVESAVCAAEDAFLTYRRLPLAKRADFLVAIAEQLRFLEEALVSRARLETGLPQARLEGELTRTINQLLLFADFVRDGAFLQPRIDLALPDRQPVPRPDIRLTQIPVGPVAVFGASNFPLAFSVAGGDTAAAFAAGCPVVVKGHPAHPGTCELAAVAIVRALEKCSLPKGVFSLLQGSRHELGAQLVEHPLLQAVAFTGSLAGGRRLFDLAATRPFPIPVYAEMGSVNPIFVLPGALAEGGEPLAQEYAASIALGVGQFCTNPGLVFVLDGPEMELFIQTVEQSQAQSGPAPMLHPGIKLNYRTALKCLADRPGVDVCRESRPMGEGCTVTPALLRTTAESFLNDTEIAAEVFGPASVVVVCDSFSQMKLCAAALAGQLTASVHALPAEEPLARELFTFLERKAGRLILNGFPTGVEVCSAMVHGGPYPATTDMRSTSVGTEAIRRFLRPICLQNFSMSLLPEELK